MRSLLIASLLLAVTCVPPAFAASAGLGVGVEVLPARNDPALVEQLPMPGFSRAMPAAAGHPAVAILDAGIAESTGHFQAAMPARGYRLVSQQQQGTRAVQLWSLGDGHVRIEFEQAMGGERPLVRMRASGHRSPPVLASL